MQDWCRVCKLFFQTVNIREKYIPSLSHFVLVQMKAIGCKIRAKQYRAQTPKQSTNCLFTVDICFKIYSAHPLKALSFIPLTSG